MDYNASDQGFLLVPKLTPKSPCCIEGKDISTWVKKTGLIQRMLIDASGLNGIFPQHSCKFILIVQTFQIVCHSEHTQRFSICRI